MQNEQLRYYNENQISPERQNIEEIENHFIRRAKLYRQCGLPEIVFKGAEMLEVGPGGGYNALAFFQWNCKHIDLVDANPWGINEMKSLFEKQGIAKNQYDIYHCEIENYSTPQKYDIVIAEGILTCIHNQAEVISKLKTLLRPNGVVVVTCIDKVSFFIETIKRLVGMVFVQNISSYEEKVKYLVDIFRPQLATLKGVSKLPEDWVKDTILNPSNINGVEFSLRQAMQYFEDFEVLGTSPQIFTDYSWYKDIWYDYKKDYLEQFDRKRLSLLMANMQEVILPADKVEFFVKCIGKIKDAEAGYEKTYEANRISEILEVMNSMDEFICQYLPKEFIDVFHDMQEILICVHKKEEVNFKNYSNFFKAFGRTQQYISFIKK
ncbi:MAG: class I SAM-dependent methyltransferase [Lachnospiraceae bacterium]|nr:class I SAM-dependent methyltransferase [Lachnospiraceae bacterium]